MSTISKSFTPYHSTQASYLNQRNGGTLNPTATKLVNKLVEEQQLLLAKKVPEAELTDLFTPNSLPENLKWAINPAFGNYYARSESAIKDHIASLQSALTATERRISDIQKSLAPPADTNPNKGLWGLWSAKNAQTRDVLFKTGIREELEGHQNYKDGLQAQIEALRFERSAEDLKEIDKEQAFKKGVQHFQGATPTTWPDKFMSYVAEHTPEGEITATLDKKDQWLTLEHENDPTVKIVHLPTVSRLQDKITSTQEKYPNSRQLLYGKMIELPYLNPTGHVITQLNPRTPREI